MMPIYKASGFKITIGGMELSPSNSDWKIQFSSYSIPVGYFIDMHQKQGGGHVCDADNKKATYEDDTE